ncbi:MAG TPA: regulatory protein RecX, partial [Actinomycetota bacterium]|nr:regulatory protein RecX [Actinomycetota bacterium]
LARRGYFRQELADRLLRAGHDSADVEAALSRLEALDLVDDGALAREWVAERVRAKPRSREALRRELEAKGVGPGLVEQVLDSCLADDLDSARSVAATAIAGMSGLTLEVQARRLRSRLLSRGFDEETVAEAIQAALPPEGWD